MALVAAAAISDKKGFDVLLLDVSDLVVVTDIFLIATGTSSRHVKTLVEEVERVLKEDADRRPLRREGVEYAKWVLLDYGDFVVHIFSETAREFYRLEALWFDAREIDPASIAAGAAG